MCSIYKVCVYLLLAGCTHGRAPSDDPKEIEIRLVGGSSNVPGRVASGRVEVRKPKGDWGTICDDSWDVLDATVACRQLGYVWGEAHREGRFGLGTGNIYYDSMDCNGTERSLPECSHDGWGENDCFHDEDAAVTCYNQTVQFAGKTNLGTIQIRYSLQVGTNNFTWAHVCDDEWDDLDATVMCKQLGYVYGVALRNSSFNLYGPLNQADKDSQEISLTGFHCQGSETDLQGCRQSGVLTKGCGDKKYAAGVCYNTTKENVNTTIAVRINAKNKNESYWGRVEVRYLDVWGHVCKDNWDDRDAAVVCRQSGYLGGKAYGPLYNSNSIESSTLTAEWLNDVDCNGKENTLQECKFSFQGKIINCQPAYVLCYNISGISISIVADSPVRGRVEITYDGIKGAICKESWSHFDAVVVCQQLGYIDGDSSDGSFTGNYFMNRLRCNGLEKSLLMCANAGWKAVTNCNEAGYVTCYRNVRLSEGNALSGSGIVEIYNNGSWDGLCDDGFNDTNAQVVCRELGYMNGGSMPIGAFGSYYGDLVRPYISCKGNESSIHGCSYSRRSRCGQFKYDYASVSCYNQTESLAFRFKLQGSSPTSDYGRVFYYYHGIWGDICGLYWNEIDATIFCKSLNNNYKGGVPLYYSKIPNTATVIGEIDCKGTEVSIENCTKVDTACYSSYSAGALCYKVSAPVINLIGGGKNFGRVSINIDGQSGTICDNDWTQSDAMVICKQFNKNFRGGEPYSNFPKTDGDVVLSQPRCSGTETSILACVSDGWKQVTSTQCLQHSLDVGVYCYSNVRLMGGSRSADYIAGRLEVLDVSGANNWLTVCATSFNQSDADTVCRDLGFPYAEILAPVSFGEASSWRYYTDMTCKEDGTNTHKDCTFEAGFCKDSKRNQASVLCSKSTSDPNLKFSIRNNIFHGEVLVEQFGMNGTICTDGWDNRDANVLCKQQGYAGGVAFGVPISPGPDARENPVWFTEVNCMGNETFLKDCPMSRVVNSKCSFSERSASVICFKSGEIKVRLANSNGSDHYGRVEIQYEGVWGTVCDYGWSVFDARVLCRQQGFKDGIAFKKSPYGPGTGPVYLSDMACDSTEATLLACPNKGWTNVDSMCKDHTRDASVYCYREVMTNIEDNYGPVNVWNDGKYSAVCSDDFDDKDAKVACRNMGFEYGTSLCCSAFGDVNSSPILISNVNCIGTEVNFTQCPYEYGALSCKSKEYASVVCSKTEPQFEFDVRLSNNNFGLVMLKWYNQWGYVCSEGFDARDANVTCKQLGFSGGFSYRSAESVTSHLTSTKKLHWVSGISCNGTEKRLEECGPLKWGKLKKCSFDSHAAAFCYMKEEDSQLEVRIKGGNIPGEGLVEIRLGGVWGSICGQTMTDDEATVLCRMNNFKYGTRIRYHKFGSLNGQVAINFMKCKGNETSIVDCPLSGFGDQPSESCLSHRYDLAVKCYAHVRLSGFTSPSYGQLQVLRDKQWVSVCDQGFGDKEAEVVCKTLGHKSGKAQCCSALGTTMTKYNPIVITNVKCQGMEINFDQCVYSIGQCTSGNYVSVACNMDSTPVEAFAAVNFTEGLFYGSLEVRRFGITGSVCDMYWNDKAANVTCKMMGYQSGFAINVTYTGLLPILISNINCTGEETSLDQCKYDEFINGHNCTERLSQAGVVCSQYANEKIMYRLGNRTEDVGRAEVYLNGKWGTICDVFWEDDDSDVFCRQIGYAGGRESSAIYSGSEGQHIWMNRVECNGNETDFRQCRATWDKKKVSSCSHYNDAGVVCYQSVRLNRGDFLTSKTNGIVEIFRNGVWGTICANGFTRKEADVACRVLGHEHGLPLCCAPYGHNFRSHSILNINCTGTEKQLTDCNYVVQSDDQPCSYQSYAAVSCYNGSQPVDDHALTIVGEQPYTGQLALKYLRVSGRVCSDGWDDKDASVACRELGYENGQAYLHYKSPFTFLEYEGPYWTSQVECTGNESHLSECKHIGFGNVTVCDSRHYAGVFCYSNKGIFYKLTGGGDRFGRVTVVINGEEGTICNRNWDSREADVICRQLGFSTGEIYAGTYTDVAKGKVWDTHFMCTGYENDLNECVLGGWELATRWSCEMHKDDVGVSCYSNVKLSTLSSRSASSGAVQLYRNSRWWRVCDDGFDDFTAKKVCEELGFVDGRSICCSGFGVTYTDVIANNTLHCDRDDKSITACIKDKPCNSSFYASAVCFSNYSIEENKYNFSLEKRGNGQVKVDHYGITGRICSRDWDDKDALVMCRMSGFKNGIAYQHSESTVLEMLRGPYWLAGLNCTGNETDLMMCPHNDRTDLGNCSNSNIASVLCYNGASGLQYNISGGNHYGRVELAIEGVWGTICDSYWDKREAEVLCRQLNYTDGDIQPRGYYGEGKGPIWLSHLECTGEESNLHECPHRGFSSEDSDILDLLPSMPCETHKFDASVYCYKHVRLNQSPNLNMGGVEMHHEGKWYGICDVRFDIAAARVACRSLDRRYIDARPVGGSSFGNMSVPIGISTVKCQGTEEDISQCLYVFNSTCISNTYASVVCSNVTIVDKGFDIHISKDVMSGPSHGILEVKMNGVWGRVCLKDFDDKDARVACRQMKYDDGVAYLHIMRNRGPFLLRGMRCNGNESSLLDCPRNQEVDLTNCSHGAYDAGVICYNTSMITPNKLPRTRSASSLHDGRYGCVQFAVGLINGMAGFSYRLNGGPNNSSGRVEINFMDEWGQVCSGLWRTPEANVVCRSLNFTSGLISYNYNDSLPQILRFVDAFYCDGTEATLMTCLNTGLNKSIPYTGWGNQCIVNDPGTYVSCYNVPIKATKIQLISNNKNNSLSGRLEVFVEGPNQWGTVCDKYFSDSDAAVVCRQLGFSGGIVAKAGTFSLGQGPIWYEDVFCSGEETTLFNCKLSELGTKSPSKSCSHLQDVGVVCSAATTTTTTTTTTSNSTISTTTPMTTSRILTTESTISSSKSTIASEPTTVGTTTRTTTAIPSVTTIPTTEKIKTTTAVTASTTSPSTTASTTRTTITVSTTPVPSSSSLAEPIPGASEHRSEEGPNLAMIVAIPAVIVIAIIITLALVFLFKIRRVKQRGFPHERFDESIIDHGQDGSIIASNQLFDLHSANGVSHSPPDDKLTISQNGNAYYSRGSPLQFDSDSNAFTNPLYESSQETNLNNGDIATLPVNEELSFGASSMNDENETQT